jgi:hypothetical protein
LAHDTRLGVKRRASAGVFVNSLKPQRMSAESFESSSYASVSGFFGKSQAVTIVVRAGISGPASGTPDDVVGRGGREQLTRQVVRMMAEASVAARITEEV